LINGSKAVDVDEKLLPQLDPLHPLPELHRYRHVALMEEYRLPAWPHFRQ
jgi:hypothetical protein